MNAATANARKLSIVDLMVEMQLDLSLPDDLTSPRQYVEDLWIEAFDSLTAVQDSEADHPAARFLRTPEPLRCEREEADRRIDRLTDRIRETYEEGDAA